MKQTIYIIDYRPSTDPRLVYRGNGLAKIIDGFTIGGIQPFDSKFFLHAKDVGWRKGENSDHYLESSPYLVFLHSSNKLLEEDKYYYSVLIEYCRKKSVPVILFTGETPGPGQVNATRLKYCLERVLKKLSRGLLGTSSEIENRIIEVVNEKSIQDDVNNHYNTYIKPQLSLLHLTLEGFLLLHGDIDSTVSTSIPEIADSHVRTSASNWGWFSPLLASDKKQLEDPEDFTSYCRLFTPLMDLKLSQLYCLSLAEKSGLPDEGVKESLIRAFGDNDVEKVVAVNRITHQDFTSIEAICHAQYSVGKMLKENAESYTIPMLINPKNPPLLPEEKKYLESFLILDGQLKATLLNLWSQNVSINLAEHTRKQLTDNIRQFVLDIIGNKKSIVKEKRIEDIEPFKKKVKDVYGKLSVIIRYMDKEFGE